VRWTNASLQAGGIYTQFRTGGIYTQFRIICAFGFQLDSKSMILLPNDKDVIFSLLTVYRYLEATPSFALFAHLVSIWIPYQ
jgi:hypothetical protein